MALDSLQIRQRLIALFERYGSLLTDHQRDVLDLHLRSDWSLSEIALHQRTSRAAVHDIIRRSTAALQDYEMRLGLLAEAQARRHEVQSLEREVVRLRNRMAKLYT